MTDMTFVFCSSGLIFFFVKTDVALHPNSESIPLLLDRVSIDWMLVYFSHLFCHFWHHTQTEYEFTNIFSRAINSCHLVSQSDVIVLFCVFWWCCRFQKTIWLYIRMLILSAENKFKQLRSKFLRVLDRCHWTEDQALCVSSTHLAFCELCAQM